MPHKSAASAAVPHLRYKVVCSQTASVALENTKIKSKTTLDAVLALNKLGENNQVLIIWIPAHSGYLGNEKAESLAKRRANNTDATLLKLPIPKAT